MMPKLKLTTVFETSDGSIFKDETKAREHELGIVKRWLYDHIDDHCPSDCVMTAKTIQCYIIDNWEVITQIMKHITELSGDKNETQIK